MPWRLRREPTPKHGTHGQVRPISPRASRPAADRTCSRKMVSWPKANSVIKPAKVRDVVKASRTNTKPTCQKDRRARVRGDAAWVLACGPTAPHSLDTQATTSQVRDPPLRLSASARTDPPTGRTCASCVLGTLPGWTRRTAGWRCAAWSLRPRAEAYAPSSQPPAARRSELRRRGPHPLRLTRSLQPGPPPSRSPPSATAVGAPRAAARLPNHSPVLSCSCCYHAGHGEPGPGGLPLRPTSSWT